MLDLTPMNRRRLKRHNMDDFWDMTRMMEQFFEDPFERVSQRLQNTFRIDIQDLEHAYRVEAELPGIQKEEVKLDYRDGILSICVTHTQDQEEKEEQYIRRERRISSMSRTIHLPDVRVGEIDAHLNNGLLVIDLPKTDKAEKRVEIEVK